MDPTGTTTRLRTSLVTLAALLCLIGVAAAQRRFFYGWNATVRNIPYDGRFTFVRVKYTPAPGGYWPGDRPSWVHGYPLAEQNLMRIMNEISLIDGHADDINVVTLDDPELFKYPIAYIIEVGWWTLTDREAAALRMYLQKGGFLIVDDFKVQGWRGLPGGGWQPFEDNVKRLFPGVKIVDMDPADPIFHAFFEIKTLDNFPQAYTTGKAIFRGVYEDNDPQKRLMMIVNYNTDISQYWEWSGRGLRPFDDTNEAYKLGVNYLIYGLTH
ncbi:MAG TPA: DUF4159 domain-containing protein [Vicinamibacterales bacterium]|jgi:hypothetical protein|nr:DUF4159 domain-containing protein [Vicinamibacterales bacterium]